MILSRNLADWPMPESIEQYIRRKNIERFRQCLKTTIDEAERSALLRLLAEEESKLPVEEKSETARQPHAGPDGG